MGLFTCATNIRQLPEDWDAISSDHPFLSRSFLQHLEVVNPCGQQYYYSIGPQGISLFVTYQHRLNILTYGIGHLALNLTVVGIPCSVSSPGFLIKNDTLEDFKNELGRIQGGVLILNSGFHDLAPHCVCGQTLPTCILKTNGLNFRTYLDSMRSHYRYKIMKSMQRFAEVQITKLDDNSCFSPDFYRLYEQVFDRSDFKLEKLPISFFQQSKSQLTLFEKDNEPLAFCQTKLSERNYYFLFGGIDYNNNHRFDTYFNMLIHIVKSGFEHRVETIDLGQTAEWVKMRLGCTLDPRYLFARHSNPLIHFGIKKGIHLLGYRNQPTKPHVFKGRRK
ncbi:GNAT family N-acetyltransferase [Desulfopila sp. IMCC35008]|uniref:GNAT family N-acetyltransferase n=1 Tax=Desulfopila sp. IMCC35008 TaxID=2653858 RepID=UPI0013D69EBE|nr:GNAT family N-acetyltransferase [Desulfopila sp. IMCC35008]